MLLDRSTSVAAVAQPAGQRTRIHGDYHLGQVLRVKDDFVILDFEGEPARPLAERRAKHSPLKDVAGMLRSFSYAAWAGLLSYTTRRPEALSRPRAVGAAVGTGGIGGVPARLPRHHGRLRLPAGDDETFAALLDAYVLDKALYELTYELDNRPTWLWVPLGGILALDVTAR